MLSVDLVLHGGRVWTAETSQPWAQSLAIKDGLLIAVGADQDMPRADHSIDLKGRVVLPGLWDAHIHFYYWTRGLEEVQLFGVESLVDLVERVSAAVPASSDDWVVGQGWNETLWDDPREPVARDLDGVTGDSPAILWRADMHSAVANTKALELAGLLGPAKEIPGGVVERDPHGRATGILRELAINEVRNLIPQPSQDRIEAGMRRGMEVLHRLGVTGICEQRMKDHNEGPTALASFERLELQGELDLRVSCNLAAHALPHLESLGLPCLAGGERLRLGHVKIFTDGTLGSRTAWMLEPFAGKEDYGVILTPPEQIAEEVARACELGFPVSIHAIGDQANRRCLDIFEAQLKSGGRRPRLPHRLEHVQLIDTADVPRLAELGLTASLQPAHLLDDMDTADEYLAERANLAYRIQDLAKHGTLLAFGSDAPVADCNPFYGIHGAVCRQRPERMNRSPWFADQRLSLEETLSAYTLGAATAAGWNDISGSLKVGKRADLCVLDRDIFQLVEAGIKGDELAETLVELTVFDGRIVYQR